MKSRCRECLKMVDKIPRPTLKYPKLHVDSKGSWWNYNLCPACFKLQKRGFKPLREDESLGAKEAPIRDSKRVCLKCENLIKGPNYFYHEDCKPESFRMSEDVSYTFNHTWR